MSDLENKNKETSDTEVSNDEIKTESNTEIEDTENANKEPEKKTPAYRGLYEHVHISVKALNIIIIVCIVVIVVLLAIDLRNPGFTISFDTKGGTPIESYNQMYDEPIKLPEDPIKKDQTFDGWYVDPDCEIRFESKDYKVHEDLTLYAGWK